MTTRDVLHKTYEPNTLATAPLRVCVCVCVCLCVPVCACVCGEGRGGGVDFIDGDFNMSAFSTVGDVFSDSEFAAPGNSLLWGLGGLDDTSRECTGILIMPKRPYEWIIDAHGCYKYDNAELGFGPRVFLHLRTTNPPGPDSICAVNNRNKEGLSADITNPNV